jgi:ABC-type transport system involved in cytochrome bd biosynthesis fused ATPase/permease subunit
MLAMARALMSQPKVLLLDEPSMGLSPIMVDKIFEVVRDVSAQGVTILLVEQNAQPRAADCRPRLRDGLGRDHHDRHRQGPADRPEGARLPTWANNASLASKTYNRGLRAILARNPLFIA